MKTPTHILIGYVMGRLLPGNGRYKSLLVAVGAAVPDVPLIVVAGLSWIAVKTAQLTGFRCADFVCLVDYFYFQSSLFIASHHLLHSPTSLVLILIFWSLWCRDDKKRLFQGCYFLLGAGSHSLIDLFTHAEDGVLVFWPWNWSYRFNSGVDQWNMAGTGQVLLILEVSLFLIFALHFLYSQLRDVDVSYGWARRSN